MSKRIPYNAPDGAIGYITDVTKEDFYNEPDIGLYDELEQSCYELVCDFAELIGVKLDREEPDFSLANHIRDTVINLLEKEFGIPFPVHGETDLKRDIRIRDAQHALFKLKHKSKYEELCDIAAEQGDVCVLVDAEHGQFIIDSGSSESLMAIAEQLGISSDNICDSSVYHKAYIELEKEQKIGLDEQIAVASTTKEYELTLFQGKENEQMIRAFLTEEQAAMICKSIGGHLQTERNITFADGSTLDVGCIDAIEILDGDCLMPERQVSVSDKER